ncbi:hypothetical protein EGR_02022 [Echinococcus granulosus]|uniref:Uncharacterized protein n=1 Tax=Echinococcus granulosus TaxID=6210 RepID=W6UPM4_ECHGR|nr:hypothetical protein EGR_02022 [Echinococcus granulosus]EUB63218.1 hypothetical protein EGR_02022 [Echinococcus granulosus]
MTKKNRCGKIYYLPTYRNVGESPASPKGDAAEGSRSTVRWDSNARLVNTHTLPDKLSNKSSHNTNIVIGNNRKSFKPNKGSLSFKYLTNKIDYFLMFLYGDYNEIILKMSFVSDVCNTIKVFSSKKYIFGTFLCGVWGSYKRIFCL